MDCSILYPDTIFAFEACLIHEITRVCFLIESFAFFLLKSEFFTPVEYVLLYTSFVKNSQNLLIMKHILEQIALYSFFSFPSSESALLHLDFLLNFHTTMFLTCNSFIHHFVYVPSINIFIT